MRAAMRLRILVALSTLAVAGSCTDEPAAPTREEVRVPSSNILVVYYSRTGNTARVAEAVAKRTGADVEALVDTVERRGAGGFVRAMKSAFARDTTTLAPLSVDPAAYDLVLVGTPDWGGGMSAPTRTFLQQQRGRLASVGFFLTDGEADHAKVLAEMATTVGRRPVAVLGVPDDDVKADRCAAAVNQPATITPRSRSARGPTTSNVAARNGASGAPTRDGSNATVHVRRVRPPCTGRRR